ncbi:hypothetical protein [Paraclostridium bifermentans]|uniref:HK97 gp10 family phage protein n=1 Tax=Paraclostridium bifermentans TaxID=1490 RepID=A0ABY8R014_PARBF|nr:hypothetical protein [Paraclostridium bifermentans]TQO55821.1 hypothetical protein D5S05_16835 [Paraclostridium bifermentans]WGX74889.1 hypothetical protein QJS64_12215 [Paraclostridium bifermentans]
MSSFKLDIDPIVKGLINQDIKARASLGLLGDSIAKDMEAYAKTNRPWNDISGDARDRLFGESENLGTKVRCSISHGVDYGVYLEMCNEGKYKILKPTIDAIGPKAIKGLDKIFK